MIAFLNKLLGRKNRTADWPAILNSADVLQVNLDTHRFGGVAIGDPIDKLSFLGPAANCYQITEMYHYPKQGFYITEDDGRLEAVIFLWNPAPEPSFVGQWVYDNQPFPIHAQTQPAQVEAMWGKPTKAYTEEMGELVWLYQFSTVEWEFAWTPESSLESIEMRELGHDEGLTPNFV